MSNKLPKNRFNGQRKLEFVLLNEKVFDIASLRLILNGQNIPSALKWISVNLSERYFKNLNYISQEEYSFVEKEIKKKVSEYEKLSRNKAKKVYLELIRSDWLVLQIMVYCF